MITEIVEVAKSRTFFIRVMGRTLEHLGVQMYKRRDVAIAELVANSWDAGATEVHINIPTQEEYDQTESSVLIIDDGSGMAEDQVENEYLVVGRNRRRDGGTEVRVNAGEVRPVMGRKGIGKLAGFGIASKMKVTTWREGEATSFTLDMDDLKREGDTTDNVPIAGVVGTPPEGVSSLAGTAVELRELKHKTPLDLEALKESLGRRFSRLVLGRMKIYVNGEEVGKPDLELMYRFPEEGGYAEAQLDDGNEISYRYAFAEKPIRSTQMRGFTVYVQGKTAQGPPFFFNVEGTASGQHGTRYLTGEIVADFLDKGIDDQSDLVSTDRQEIEWENESTLTLYEWGQTLTRKLLRERAKLSGRRTEQRVLEDENIARRIGRLDPASQKQVSKFLLELGSADPEEEDVLPLADSLVKAFEYQHFHDVIEQIENVEGSPEQLKLLLQHLNGWKVLESRAILEIIKGRVDIIHKFREMVVENYPETASKLSPENMHDLLAGYPWLLNPEWQVLAEEKRISTQLKEWNAKDVDDEDERMRYDFLALTDERRLVIVEIKRSGHPLEFGELQRLETYQDKLSKGSDKDLYMLMVCGNIGGLRQQVLDVWEEREDGDITTWNRIYERTLRYYQHYEAVLEGNVEDSSFYNKETEVQRTREVLTVKSIHRGPAERAAGLGTQDVEYES